MTNLLDSGSGSLRDAISTTPAGGTVIFQSGLSGSIPLSTTLTISKDLTITGPGASQVNVDGGNVTRVFDVTSGNVTISGLTVSHGAAGSGDYGVGGGGAIRNAGNLILSDDVLDHNTGYQGGAVYNEASLSVNNSTFSNNTVVHEGGAIYTGSFLSVTNSTFNNNQTGDGSGGAVFDIQGIWAGTASAWLTNCTLTANHAASGGGAIQIWSGSDPLTLTGDTITGNSAGIAAGGVNAATNVTPSVIRNCIISGNVHGTNTPDDLYGSAGCVDFFNSTYNLIGNAGATGLTNGFLGNIVGQNDPHLGALSDNGGPTQTMALLSGSAAINNGAGFSSTDQRGYPRVVNGHVDIGAFETQAVNVVSINRTTPAGPTTAATSVSYTVTFGAAVSGVDATDFKIDLNGSVAATTPVVVTSVSGSVYTVTINGIHGSGTLGLDLINNGSIPGLTGSFTGQTYNILQTYPQVVSINRTTPAGPLTNSTSVSYTVTFSEDVTAVDATDFAVANTNTVGETTPVVVTPVSASVYTVTINGVHGVGTLGLNLVDNGSIHDLAGNPLTLQNVAASFGSQSTYGGGAGYLVQTADLNGDGKLDVVTANSYQNSVSVYLGNGNGMLQASTSYNTGDYTYSAAIGDVNGDGKPDLVVANDYANTVGVLLGNGDGTFQTPPSMFPVGVNPRDVAVADVNGDGKPDVITANEHDGTVSVLLGNGDGTFQPQQVYAVGPLVFSVQVADVNGDGKPDIIAGNYNGNNVSVLLGSGDGTFQPQVTYPTGTHPTRVAIGDLNGDGFPDLAVANFGSSNISVLLGNGDGTFQPQTLYPVVAGGFSVVMADLNGDGKLDLASTNFGTNSVSVLVGNGDGSFNSPTTVATGQYPFSLAVADLNGDGRPDLLAGNFGNYNVGIRLNTGNGSTTGQLYTIDTIAPSVTITAPIDGSSTNNSMPTFSGAAGTASGDSSTITVNVYAGTLATGTPVQTLTTTASGGAYSVPASSSLDDGTYTAQASQSDAAGNTGTSTSTTFIIDTVAPSVTLTAPVDGSSANNNTPTFSGAAGTATGDSSTITVSIYSGSSTSGTLEQTLTTTASGGAYSVPASSSLADGTYTAQASQSDAAGNTGTSTSTTFIVDTVAPSVTLTAPADGSSANNNTPTFSGAAGMASGDSSMITVNVYAGTLATGTPVQTLTTTASGGAYSVPASSSLADGTYTAQASQSDAAGNTGISGTSTFTIDTVAPSVMLTAPADGSSTNNNTPTFSGAAGTATGDSSTITVSIYSGSSTSGTLEQTLTTMASSGAYSVPASSSLADGTYTAQASQSDAAGNTGISTSSTFIVDTVAPSVTLTAPADGGSTNNNTPMFSGAAGTATGDSSTISVSIYSGSTATGTPVQTLTTTASGGAYSVPASSSLADGTYTAQASQSDAAGNTGTSTSSTFIVDTVAPRVTLTAPGNDSSTNNNMSTFSGVGGVAAGDSATVTVEIYTGSTVSGSPVRILTTTRNVSSGVYSVQTSSSLADGTYTAQAIQSDAAGNSGHSSSITFRIDTVAPSVTLTAPANGSSTTNGTPAFSGSAGTAIGDSSTITVKIYSGTSATGTPVQTLIATASAAHYSIAPTTALALGTYTARASESDVAGNIGFSSANTFRVTVTPTFSNLVGPTIIYGTPFTILGGRIADGSISPGGSVAITLNGVTKMASILPGGFFSASFDTHGLGVSGSPYTIAYSYAANGYINAVSDTSKTLTVTKATSTFEWVSSPTIAYGTSKVVVGGVIEAGILVPSGNVSITINGVTQTATIGCNGQFSVAFNTQSLGVGKSPYVINYSYAGSANFTAVSNNSGRLTVTKATPTVTWNHPADIVYGTPLGAKQLNAVANVPGLFVYVPGPGTVLHPGYNQTLMLAFIPNDLVDYNVVAATVQINVLKAQPVFSLLSAPTITAGTSSVTLSGSIGAGSLLPPVGETLTITINGHSVNTQIQSQGAFSTSFDTHALAAGVYTITYSYLGDGNFNGTTDSSKKLTVNKK